LFGLAGIRNFVFTYVDCRIALDISNQVSDGLSRVLAEEKVFAAWATTRWTWAAIFTILTVGSTITLVHIMQVPHSHWIVEWMICLTLIGLIIGNIQKGTNLMRVSFAMNRVFNIVNHVWANNAIAVIIAMTAITSISVYYIRRLKAWITKTEWVNQA